jgi:hypothetical protein
MHEQEGNCIEKWIQETRRRHYLTLANTVLQIRLQLPGLLSEDEDSGLTLHYRYTTFTFCEKVEVAKLSGHQRPRKDANDWENRANKTEEKRTRKKK